jgi:hypothetical protein
MAIEGFQAIQIHLKDIQQALLNLEARVHNIEADLGNPDVMPASEKDFQDKLDVAGKELGKKIKDIIAHRETDTDTI